MVKGTLKEKTGSRDNKFLKITILIRFKPSSWVCPSVPPFPVFCWFIYSFLVLRGYFYVSLNLVAATTVLILMKLRDTAPFTLNN